MGVLGGEESFQANPPWSPSGNDKPLVSAIFINNYNIQGVQKLPVKLDMFWVGWLYQFYTPSTPNTIFVMFCMRDTSVFPTF